MRSHVFLISSPIAGYAIHIYHVASAIARPDRPVHILVASRSQTERWYRSSGRPANSNITLDVLADGRWEHWAPASRDQAFRFLCSNDLAAAVDACIRFNEDIYLGEKLAALVYSPAMTPMGIVAARRSLKPYLLMATAHYYNRLGGCHLEGEPLSTSYSLHGIGGMDTPLEVKLNDVAGLITPSYYRSVKPAMDNCAGVIYSNSNVGLDGDDFEQPHLPAPHYSIKPTFMIGPCLPRWFEDAIEDPRARDKHLLDLPQRDGCLDFLDVQEKDSVVYLSFGSSVEAQEWQVRSIIQEIRSYGLRWLLAMPYASTALKQSLAGAGDGVVTDWAPQLEILTHPAIKCVITHGGLSTLVETIIAGKCLMMCPVEADQELNAKVMAHVGVSLGSIATSTKYESSVTGSDHIQRLFSQVFGTDDGKQKVQQAKSATLALRKLIKGAKARSGALQREALCRDIALSSTRPGDEFGDASQRLFPSFVLGPW